MAARRSLKRDLQGGWGWSMLRRYAYVRQDDQSDCGAAALATIALHHRVPIGLQQMRDLAGTDRVGTNLLGLVRAAERLGFSARGVKGPFEALTQVPLPAIAHLRTEEGLGHFVVLHRLAKNGVIIADPARGIRKQSREEFCQWWTGYLLIMVPGEGLGSQTPAKASIGPWNRFAQLLRPHISILIEAVLCALLMTVLGVSTSYFVQHLVDSVLVRGEARLLNALGIGMVLIAVFRTLFGALRGYLLAHIGRKVDLALISGYSCHILGLPMRFFEMRQVGEILSRVNDAVKVREAISGTTTTAIVDGVLVILMTAILWLYDIRLALIATAFVPVLVACVMVHHPAIKTRSRQAMEEAARLSAHLVENVSGVETIKAFGAERSRAEEGEMRLVKLMNMVFSLEKLGISMNTLGLFVTALASIVVLWYGGHRVISGALTIGQLMFFSTLSGYLLDPLERLASVNVQLQDALVAVDRLYQIIDLETEPVGDGKKVRFSTVRRSIKFEKVTFKYGCRANVLEQVSLRIPAGKTVAVVGESGSGKSTLLKLLMGYYEPTEGRIAIDGIDLRDFELGSLRARVGVVAQEPFIFNGTVAENIALGRPKARRKDVIKAARAAGLDEFISGLPERYETVIGERGANLSGGQRQRLAIARALIRKPEILIFDEATSHLDTATERVIQENLKTALDGMTVVLVAHRLSTIKDADAIYVLHQGRVVERGTHRQLMRERGRYWSLWRSQTDEGAAQRIARNGHVSLNGLAPNGQPSEGDPIDA
ncbi:MAG: peptidase domain-containing ABC transporter [Isosphaeraceae bacterium]